MQWDQRRYDPDAVIETRFAGWGIVGARRMHGTEKLRDKYGSDRRFQADTGHLNRLGSYDSHDGWTRDKYGNPVGRGNLLTTLLK